MKLRVRRESGSGYLWVGDMHLEEGEWTISDLAYNYFYDNAGNLIMIGDDNETTPPTRYIYAGSRLLANEENGNLYFYHLDRIGSPIMITNKTGNVVKEKKYEAFGNLVSSSGTYQDNREFTSKEKDPTGFHYFGARYYSGDIGRFLSPDPHTLMPGNIDLTNSQELNPYVYCVNNPLQYIDPSGLDWFDMGYDIDDEHYTNMQWIEGSAPQAYNSLSGPRIAESLGEEVLAITGREGNEAVNEATFEYYSRENTEGPVATIQGASTPADPATMNTMAEGLYTETSLIENYHGSGINAIAFAEGTVRSTDFEVMTNVRVHGGNVMNDAGKFGYNGRPWTTGCPTFGYGSGMYIQAWGFGAHFTNATNVYLQRIP